MVCFDGEVLKSECFETVIQTISEGIIIINKNGKISFCNNSFYSMTGFDAIDVIGKDCNTIICTNCNAKSKCKILLGEIIDGEECSLLRKNGTSFPVIKNARPLKSPNGIVIGTVETITDISIQKSAEKKLRNVEDLTDNSKSFEGIISNNHLMKQIFVLIKQAGASNATVLISGESGTGKELVAKAIHNRGNRSSGPLVKVNCSALPENLLESELFGHVKGAFTGAIADKKGRFEIANGGSLFLDEIGEISPLIQVKLLRFLQEREFERVGDTKTRKVDVRVIAATNKDLRMQVNNGLFRDDLFYRLKVFPITMPPLRERKEDIGHLVEHFVRKFNKETGKTLEGLDHDSAMILMDYCWPGNVRELENAIEHAFVICQKGRIGVFELPLEIRQVEFRRGECHPFTLENKGRVSDNRDRELNNQVFIPQRKKCGKSDILYALEMYAWNRSRTAEYLGIDRSSLWRKMKKYKIQEDE